MVLWWERIAPTPQTLENTGSVGISAIIPYGDLSRFGRDHLRVGLYTDDCVKHKLKNICKQSVNTRATQRPSLLTGAVSI